MKLFIRTPERKDYHRQFYSIPSMPQDIKPGDTLNSLTADYHIDKIEYSRSELIVYATKTQISNRREN